MTKREVTHPRLPSFLTRYSFEIIDDVLVLRYIGASTSITNNAETVLADLHGMLGTELPSTIIYLDDYSVGWNRLIHSDGVFEGYSWSGDPALISALKKIQKVA